MSCRKLHFISAMIVLTGITFADPNDFVNPKYVVAARDDPATKAAQATIVRSGNTAAKKGPWTIIDSEVRASTNNPHDYLSWAPYHWPNCNWCDQSSSVNDPPPKDGDDTEEEQTLYAAGVSVENLPELPLPPDISYDKRLASQHIRDRRDISLSDMSYPALKFDAVSARIGKMGEVDPFNSVEKKLGITEDPSSATPISASSQVETIQVEVTLPLSSSITITAAPSDATNVPIPDVTLDLLASIASEFPLVRTLGVRDAPILIDTVSATIHTTRPTPGIPPIPTTAPDSSTTSSPDGIYDPTENPLRAQKPSKTTGCTTSPTTSMAPSATWSACPYKARDGRVNPDVHNLRSAGKVVEMSQAVLWNAIGFVSSSSDSNAKDAAFFINTFFMKNETLMNPSAQYGQVVRGPPGTQSGSYMGVLDMRGLVKVVNAVLVLRESKSQYWTQDMDTKMNTWASRYVRWVEVSAAGKKAGRAANNHGSFYPNQIAALKILMGDIAGARSVLQSYFSQQFQEQVISSGEQPLEAARTRPFHYRCFNLEAIITNAKLGDYIGMNFWDHKSKYGATIQTAVNHLMSLDPGKERVEEALPHVAAVMAVYGDPQGKYARYLKQANRNYTKKPFWFYDQPAAITQSRSRPRKGARDEPDSNSPTPTTESNDVQGSDIDQDHPPSIFSNGQLVELEEGLFVGWEDVRQFYRKVEKRRVSVERRRTRVKKSVPHQAPTPRPPPMFQDGKEVELDIIPACAQTVLKGFYEPNTDSS